MGLFDYGRQYAGNLAKVQSEFDSGDRNLGEYVLGTAAYGLGQPAADLVGVPLGYAVDAIPDSVKQGALSLARQAGLPEAAQYVGQQIDKYVPESVQRGVGEATMFAEAFPMFRATGLLRDPAAKGMFLSSGEVYKKGNYRPDDVALSPAEEILGGSVKAMFPLNKLDSAVKVKGFTPSQILNNVEAFYKQKKGTLEWGAKGFGRVANLMFNPKARALYTERGISPVFDTYYQMYKKAEAADDKKEANKALRLAQSQMQQMANIKAQSGQVTRGKDATKDFINAAADPDSPGAFFNAGEMGKGWFGESTKNAKVLRKNEFGEISKADTDFIEDYLVSRDVWDLKDPNRVNVIVKTPRADMTGNHFKDILGWNPKVSNIAEVFSDSQGNLKTFSSPDDLRTALIQMSRDKRTYKIASGENKPGDIKKDVKTGKDIPHQFSIAKVADDGVWVKFTDIGEAYVEGGTNALVKVGLDGQLTGVMSDLHNFYERVDLDSVTRKVPGAGKVLDAAGVRLPTIDNVPMRMALPEEVLAVTPPMRTHVVEIGRKSTFNDNTRGAFEFPPQKQSIPIPEEATVDAVRQRVEAAGQITPSTGEVLRESVPVAQNVALMGGGLQSALEEDDPLAPTIQ